MRAFFLPFALLAALPSWLHLPTWAERWLYNPRERTETALGAVEKGKAEDAVPPLDTAARLDEQNPSVQYNAGSGHLLANQGKEAVPYLEKAAEKASPELRPRVSYNLGNAKYASGDASGAVEAYKQALRLDPANEDAKWNLELALRQLEKERQAKKPQETPEGKKEGQKEQSQGSGSQDPSQSDQQPSKAQDPDKNAQQPQQQGGGQPRAGKGMGSFEDQPDMTAQQAAALLESVENLERQQRKAELARRTRKTPKGVKDW